MKDPSGHIRLDASLRECCEQPPDFTELRGFFVMLLQRHFSNSADYGTRGEEMKCLVYDLENPDKSELPVGLDFGMPDTPTNSRGVRLFMQDFAFQPMHIGMETSLSSDNATIFTVKKYTGMMRVVVAHESAEVAYALAESIVPFLEGTRMAWMEIFHLLAFHVTSLGPAKKQMPNPEGIFQAMVTAQMQGTVITGLTEESLRLKKIKLRTNLV